MAYEIAARVSSRRPSAKEMIGIRIDATASRSMDRESHKRERAEDPAYGGGKMVGKDFRPPEKKTQHNNNLQQPQHNNDLLYLRQQQLQRNFQLPNPTRSESSSSTSVLPKSPFVAVATNSGSTSATPFPTTTGVGRQKRPTAVFDFPWQEERLAFDMDGWSFRDVFFSSLVDGCSARIGLPGDRLGRRAAPFTVRLEDFPWGALTGDHEETDGADYIWSCPLQQPLIAAGRLSPSSTGISPNAL